LRFLKQAFMGVLLCAVTLGASPAMAQKPVPPPLNDAAVNLQAATLFLATNPKRRGVVTTASGLQYRITKSGPPTGLRPAPNSIVRVNYEGKLMNGRVFDSSFARGQAAEFPVNALIPAWVEALQLMRPGDEWTIWVPPSLGYGTQGAGRDIPPNALLIFRMHLEAIVN
jgi:FKBP-type peptidyl-prolyl cis-trans isomerase FklB